MSDFLYKQRWLFVILLFCFGFLIPSSGAAFIYGIVWALMALLILGGDLE